MAGWMGLASDRCGQDLVLTIVVPSNRPMVVVYDDPALTQN